MPYIIFCCIDQHLFSKCSTGVHVVLANLTRGQYTFCRMFVCIDPRIEEVYVSHSSGHSLLTCTTANDPVEQEGFTSYRKSAHQVVIYINCNDMVSDPSCAAWSDIHRINAPPPSIVSPGCSAECQNLPTTISFRRSPYFADQYTTIFHCLTWMLCRMPGSAILYPALKITIFCRSAHHHFPFSHLDVLQNTKIRCSLPCSEDHHTL